jgi:hypothetical protein
MIRGLIGISFRVVVLGAIGLGTTVGVAWWSAYEHPDLSNSADSVRALGPTHGGWDAGAPENGSVELVRTRMATRVTVVAPFRMMRCGTARMSCTEEAKAEAARATPPPWDQVTPRWARSIAEPILRAPVGQNFMELRLVSIEAHGWPARALSDRVDDDFQKRPPRTICGAIDLTFASSPSLVRYRGYGVLLPCRPIYLGLIADSGLFAMPWAVAMLAIGPVRRAIRRGRGQCASCGYDRAGLPRSGVCPECGHGAVNVGATHTAALPLSSLGE